MKRIVFLILTVSSLIFGSCCRNNAEKNSGILYQVNPLDGLMQGYYDGNFTVGDFKAHGNFGIGTFNGTNGELICLDGTVYQALYDGSVVVPEDKVKIPFCAVTEFKSSISEEYKEVSSFDQLSEKLLSVINSQGPNSFFAIKIHGNFNSIKVRSELMQKKPYRNFAEALKTDQREFTYTDLPGTLVIMYNPRFMGQINSYGLHMHFISDDKTKGGHVLALSAGQLSAEFDKISDFKLILSDDADFDQLNFNKDMKEVTKYAEFNK